MESSIGTSLGEAANEAGEKDVDDEIYGAVAVQLLAQPTAHRMERQ
jgi:hypothetical protein